jgi:hypothetical protein
MKPLLLLLTAAIVALAPAAFADQKKKPKGILDPKDLSEVRSRMGEEITVEGLVVRTGESKSKTHRYLNFTQMYWESVSLVFVIDKNPAEYTLEKLGTFVGKTVRAKGKVSEYGSGVQIMIDSWDQIEVVK